MDLLHILLYLVLAAVGCGVIVLLFTLYVLIRYGHEIIKIFATKPLFLIPPAKPEPSANTIEFFAANGRRLVGSYFPRTTAERCGVVLFCHEFGASRWLYEPYVGHLRSDGFDIFTFDFVNQGESDKIPGYDPLHWVTEHEVADVQAAVKYLKERPDADPNGIGIFGVSKGGGAALVAGGREPTIRGIITDGAFPTVTTIARYTEKWVTIYVNLPLVYRILPHWFYMLLARSAILLLLSRRNRVTYSNLERAAGRLRQPWLMIHGGRDNYITKEIAEGLFRHAPQPKEFWLVPGAKHNCCLDVAGDAYRDRVREFFRQQLCKEKSASPPSQLAVG